MRGALNQGRTDEERIALVTEVLDEAGITAPPPREPLPDVEKHEVRLVTWMAVRGTRGLGRPMNDVPPQPLGLRRSHEEQAESPCRGINLRETSFRTAYCS